MRDKEVSYNRKKEDRQKKRAVTTPKEERIGEDISRRQLKQNLKNGNWDQYDV